MLCLTTPTDPGWAIAAARDFEGVLVDHAHCEMKAATFALSLVARHPTNLSLVRALTALAREELDHFDRAVAFIESRGLKMGAPPVDTYASDLRACIAKLPPSPLPRSAGLVDRLLVGAMIEARSCERFKLLIERLDQAREPELHAFYEELFACEAKHYRLLVDLAVHAASEVHDEAAARAIVTARLDRLAELEGAIVAGLAKGDERATVHG